MGRPDKNVAWDIFLLATRTWLGRSMIYGGQCIIGFFSVEEQEFFRDWFGKELGFPAPVAMAFIAKGIEFAGGILICLGLFTKVSSSLIAVVMLVATLTANINYHGGSEGLIKHDGLLTISSFLFACLLILSGPGRCSIDNFILKKTFTANKG